MENQKEKPRELQQWYMLCVMWNEGTPKEVANCDATHKNIDKKSEAKKRLVGTLLYYKLQLFEQAQIEQNIIKNKKEIWQQEETGSFLALSHYS